MVKFIIPGDAVPQQRPRFAAGHAYEPAKCKRYKRKVASIAMAEMGRCEPLAGPVVMCVRVYMQIPKSWTLRAKDAARVGDILPTRRPDADNLGKAVLDGCNGIVYEDDAQVVRLVVEKRYADEARVEVAVEAINEEAEH